MLGISTIQKSERCQITRPRFQSSTSCSVSLSSSVCTFYGEKLMLLHRGRNAISKRFRAFVVEMHHFIASKPFVIREPEFTHSLTHSLSFCLRGKICFHGLINVISWLDCSASICNNYPWPNNAMQRTTHPFRWRNHRHHCLCHHRRRTNKRRKRPRYSVLVVWVRCK